MTFAVEQGARQPPARRVLVPALGAAPSLPLEGSVVHALSGATMGTGWSLKLVAPPGFDAARIAEGVQAQLDLVVRQMSTWEPDSDLSRFNRAAPGTWHTLPPQFFHVLGTALALARGSGGAYDPTAGALVNLWGFGPEGKAAVPPDAERIAAIRAKIGWDKLRLDRAGLRVWQPGGVYVDLSAIAKGYGVDQVARYLEGAGLKHWLVEVGGELRGAGVKPDGEPWWVSLEQPVDANESLPENLLALHGLSVATSGDYRQGFEHEGLRYSHTIDPRSGRPLQGGPVSVTVLHTECMIADALATVLMVLGVEEGMVYARSAGLAALFVTRDDSHLGGGESAGYIETMTPAFAALAED